MTSSTAKPAGSDKPPIGAAEPTLLDDAKALWESVRILAHNHLQLAALETKLAGESLVTMLAAGVAVAILVVSAWLGLVGVGVMLMIESGVVASLALLSGVGLNLIVAFVLYGLIRRKSRNLGFRATVRSLRPLETPLNNMVASK